MPEPIVVEVCRNGEVEAVHRVHAVAVRAGEIVGAAGDPALTCFMRSSSKPLQALPLVRARDDLPDNELAVACASHRDTPEQVAAVRALLDRASATEDDLELGPQTGRPPQLIHHNCSGKHAGMLALCRARSWPTQGYRLPEHPVQQACRDAHAEAAEVEPQSIPTAADGCGVVTFALALERMAHAYSRLEQLPRGERIAEAMRARPDLVGGPDGTDYLLMRAASGWLAKGGAEGLLCAAGPDGLGVALKTEDGSSRPHAPALAAFLGQLGVDVSDLALVPVLNSRGERVGEVVARPDAITSSLRSRDMRLVSRRDSRENWGSCGRRMRPIVARRRATTRPGGTGTCSPSTSRFRTLRSSTSSLPKGGRRASSATTRSPTGSRTSS